MTEGKKPRGFAAMPKHHVSAIAQKGGRAAHAAGTAHQYTSETARLAGAKGGKATHAKRRAAKGLAPAGTVSGNKDMVVDVVCSSAGGCVGTVPAGSPEASEAIGKPYAKGGKAPTSSDNGPSADENPEEMGSCGTGGCGSHKG